MQCNFRFNCHCPVAHNLEIAALFLLDFCKVVFQINGTGLLVICCGSINAATDTLLVLVLYCTVSNSVSSITGSTVSGCQLCYSGAQKPFFWPHTIPGIVLALSVWYWILVVDSIKKPDMVWYRTRSVTNGHRYSAVPYLQLLDIVSLWI